MGTDEVYFVAKATSKFDRTRLRDLIVELWTGRGAKLAGTKWARSGFGYAIGPTTNGWMAVVDSGEDRAIDDELLQRVAKATNTWAFWSCDHSCLYGQKRISKSAAGKNEPVGAYGSGDYQSVRGEPGWDFLSFRGVKPETFERFGPRESTKSDPLPKDPKKDLEDEFTSVVLRLDVDRAVAIVKALGADLSDDSLRSVFSERYPIEYEETSLGVATIGRAIADVRPLGDEEWIRLLEVAAVRNDASLGKRAAKHLTRAKAKAFAEARGRFAQRKDAAATKRFEAWIASG